MAKQRVGVLQVSQLLQAAVSPASVETGRLPNLMLGAHALVSHGDRLASGPSRKRRWRPERPLGLYLRTKQPNMPSGQAVFFSVVFEEGRAFVTRCLGKASQPWNRDVDFQGWGK